MNNLVSVIIPVYNVEKYLKKCVDSVLKQTYQNLEIILVDDGSKDNCPSICDEYAQQDKRVVVIHKENGGQGSARNCALEIAKGDYISFVDSDDWIESDFVEVLLDKSLKTDADIVVCGAYIVDEVTQKKEQYLNPTEMFIKKENILDYLHKDIYSDAPWNKLYRKYIFDSIRFPKQRSGEDSCVMPEILYQANKIAVISNMLYNYNLRKGSTMTSVYTLSKLNDQQNNFCHRTSFFKSIGRDDLIKEEVLCHMTQLFPRFLRANDKNIRKEIKKIYKDLFANYKKYFTLKDLSWKLKIKTLYIKLF